MHIISGRVVEFRDRVLCDLSSKDIRLSKKSHLGLAFGLMLRPFYPELVMSTDLLGLEHL